MSHTIDKTRRGLIGQSLLSGLVFCISRYVNADGLTDLVMASSDELLSTNDDNQIVAVRVWPSSVYTRLTIEAENSIAANYFTLDSPLRFVVDINQSKLNSILQNLSNKVLHEDPIIADIKVSQFNPDTVRIVVYLKQGIQAQSQRLNPVSLGNVSYQYRYVLDMYPYSSATGDVALNDDMLALLQLNSVDDTDESSSIIAPIMNTSPITAEPIATRIIHQINPSKKILVMLDPGHGGEDPGAIGPTGTKEKDVVLDIATRLYKMVNQSDHMSAQMTRTQDIFIPLGTRVAIARRARADVFVSVHADAFTKPTARGSSVFILSDSGASSTFARWLAKTQNSADQIGGMSFNVQDKSVTKVLLDMTQTWSLKNSNKLGNILLSGLSQISTLHNKQVEKAAFAVLKSLDIPSVLVETAFISNPYEENLLKTVAFRQKMANTLLSGIDKFAQSLLRV